MADVTNNFLKSKMSKDLDERLVLEGTYRDALNISVDTTDTNKLGAVQNSLGNTKIADLATIAGQTLVNSRTIGATKYERDNLIYWLVASDKFDGIYEYNETTGATVRVIQSNKATANTASKLNFSQQYIVTGINYINGFLYWTDNYNPPRRVNISRAKSYGIDDARIDDDLNVILAPPLYSPKISLFNDGTEANNMAEKFLYFSYRFKYKDGQYSSMSPFSAVSFIPGNYYLDYSSGNNKSMSNYFNSANITVSTGGENVTDVQILMRDTRSTNISIVETINKKKLNLSNNYSYDFKFSNNKVYTITSADQATRLFDNVPLLAKAQDFVGSRLMYANYTQFYDIKDCTNQDINIDLKLSSLSTTLTTKDVPYTTFRSDRDYEVGIVYLDKYGRSTTVLTSENNTTYIPAKQSVTANSLVLNIKNQPPCWATNYRVVIKQSKTDYYNVFPLIYYTDGVYRYFLINESDRDKFKVGGYVIFKANGKGATLINKKYKVLELDLKPKGFISYNNTTELEGLYFKIKVDDPSEFSTDKIYSYVCASSGHNSSYNLNLDPNNGPYVETPIFYGKGNKNALTLGTTYYNSSAALGDKRVTVEILSQTTFRYTLDFTGNGSWITKTITTGSIPIQVMINGVSTTIFTIKINTANGLTVGDKWKINCRAVSYVGGPLISTIFGGTCIPWGKIDSEKWGGAAIVPLNNWSPTPTPNLKDRPIESGAIIELEILKDSKNPYTQAGRQRFISPARYENIEEWFIESGAYKSFVLYDSNGANIGASNIAFRRSEAVFEQLSFSTGLLQTQLSTQVKSVAPVRMIIKSSTTTKIKSTNPEFNVFQVGFWISQSEYPIICESEAKSNDLEVYHELSKTFKIKNNLHQTQWAYADFTYSNLVPGKTNLGQLVPGTKPTATDEMHYFNEGESIYVTSSDNAELASGTYTILKVLDAYNIVIDLAFASGATTPGGVSYSSTDKNQTDYATGNAVLKINNINTVNTDFNAWTYGNGLESYRALDDWNAASYEYSIRTNAVSEDYKQRVSENAICYSGIYGINTGVNRLNEFNLSIANFKYLDKKFGAINKIHARDTNLIVFQDDKVSKVLYEKNLLMDATGGGVVSSIPEVLGTQVAFPGEYGISKNPESFDTYGTEMYFTDARRGAVLKLENDQIIEISDTGMKSYFRDLFRDDFNKQKIGAYDPHTHLYTLATNNRDAIPCKLILDKTSMVISNMADKAGLFDLFYITTDSSWALSVIAVDSGTSWVTDYATSGYGNQQIKTRVSRYNGTTQRQIRFRVTYCSGTFQDFLLTQRADDTFNLVNFTYNTRRL